MEVSSSGAIRPGVPTASAGQRGASAGDFQRQLQAAQEKAGTAPSAPSNPPSEEAVAAAAEKRLNAMYFTLNGKEVSLSELPQHHQQFYREAEERDVRLEAYRAQVAENPDIGAIAKLVPYDAARDESAMERLAAMEPTTAEMSPEEYYNYSGSDREKYDTVKRIAESPELDAGRRIFGLEPELESKVQMVRDYEAKGVDLPKTYKEFEQAWLTDVVRQQALRIEREGLLGA
jgi:hypothetical protein